MQISHQTTVARLTPHNTDLSTFVDPDSTTQLINGTLLTFQIKDEIGGMYISRWKLFSSQPEAGLDLSLPKPQNLARAEWRTFTVPITADSIGLVQANWRNMIWMELYVNPPNVPFQFQLRNMKLSVAQGTVVVPILPPEAPVQCPLEYLAPQKLECPYSPVIPPVAKKVLFYTVVACACVPFVLAIKLRKELKGLSFFQLFGLMCGVGDVVSDALYFSTQPYYSRTLEAAAFGLLFCPTAIFFVFRIDKRKLWNNYCRAVCGQGNKWRCHEMPVVLKQCTIAIFWPVLRFCVLDEFVNFKLAAFPTVSKRLFPDVEQSHASYLIALNASILVELLFESLPQLCLTVYNTLWTQSDISWTFIVTTAFAALNIANNIWPLAYWMMQAKCNGKRAISGLGVDSKHNWECEDCKEINERDRAKCMTQNCSGKRPEWGNQGCVLRKTKTGHHINVVRLSVANPIHTDTLTRQKSKHEVM